jgi:two-component system sensor histidine kinase EvgS
LDLPRTFAASLIVNARDGFIRDVVFDGPATRQGVTSALTTLMAAPRGSERYPAVVLVDARAFDAVVRNLLQNAVVHGGATHVEVSVAPTGTGSIRVTLADDGRGVPQETFDSLGRSFAQGRHARGTGVGLFVCRQLMTRMNGVLGFGQPGGRASGLVVTLDLPGTM